NNLQAHLLERSSSYSNALVTYTIISGADDSFHIDPESGELIATKRLDRERRSKYSLLVRADDGLQSSDMRINITVSDVNDHIPKFSKPVSSLMENLPPGSTILNFSVTDADDGRSPNSQLSFSIASGDSAGQFGIDSSGALSIRQPLDRESQSFYSLVVQVHDMAPLPASRYTSTAQVSIILLDVNDSPPSFISPKLTYVPENTPIDTVVFRAQATDPDSGPNSYIEYSLLQTLGNKFSIGTIDGEVRLTGELDREAVANYTLTVVATDKGQPSLSSSTDVVVIVLDINDNNPLFAQKLYKVEVAENTLTGTDLIQVLATDGDEGTNGQVRYAIVGGDVNSEFRIDSVTGVITVAKPLDREKKPSYTLTVQSSDRGSSPRTDTTTVSIVLKDVNDFIPTFELSPYSVNVPENLETLPKNLSPRKILTVAAVDRDSGLNGQLNYEIIEGNTENSFSINRATGEIRSVRPLDREKLSQYTLTVKASDKGTPLQSTTVKVVINILDENDNAPRFSQIFSASVPENAPLGFTVTRVTTSDEDIGVNAVSRYSIRDTSLPFTINPSTGDITVSRPLNREDTDRYRIRVSAHDSGWTVSTDVTIFVTDVNDNAPRFTKPSYYLECPELPGIGLKVTQVSATDPDEGSNGQVFYFIKSQSEFFRINATTGEIFNKQYLRVGTNLIKVTAVDDKDFGLNSEVEYFISDESKTNKFRLDRSTGWISVSSSLMADLNKNFLFKVKAKDKGNPPLSSEVAVEIVVTEE
uniref:FAT atypical cadherin 4 n=1 Tax=Zosterops lateralis melanops TaxID=1220523 RepID=A0A8D2PXE3_ZOSLA